MIERRKTAKRNSLQIRRLRGKPAQSSLGTDDCRGDWLVDFVSDRGREHAPWSRLRFAGFRFRPLAFSQIEPPASQP